MGYRMMTEELLAAIWTRLRAGQSNRSVAEELSLDRKTVNRYAAKIREAAIPIDASYAEAIVYLSRLLSGNAKAQPSRDALEPFADEIRGLITGNRDEKRRGMKPKTAWLVVRERHGLETKASYTSFKRFVHDQGLSCAAMLPVPRIESEPGGEIQIDYGKMGTWLVTGRNRVVYAYMGVLASSRLPYIRFVTSQDQVSFAESGVAMLTFYGGSTKRFNLDNLKSGVLAVDAYDPTINRTFAELCDHYGIIADPARPVAPRDKGKVERFVQVARELWKRLTALHHSATLEELNELAETYCRNEYGRANHGTTGIPPIVTFESVERTFLRPLPAEPFEAASWSLAKVHSDQFVSVGKKLYGVPAAFIGKTVHARSTRSFVELFHRNASVRRYAIPSGRVAYLAEDFPAHAEPFKPGAYASFLRAQAGRISPQAASFIGLVLEQGGQLALRRSQGCLALITKHENLPGLSHVLGMAIAERIWNPSRLKTLFEAESVQNLIPFPVSESGKTMTRAAAYYSGP